MLFFACMNSSPDAQSRRPPLHGVIVIDFSRVIAGPFCTQILADLGADVIKIENPAGGDETRSFGHPKAGGNVSSFIAYNRTKRSVTLDLGSVAGQRIARDLIRRADVVIENFAGDVTRRHGIDYDSVRQDNPRVVYCTISAYGRTGPMAGRPGYDPVMQAESGLMTMNGLPEYEPVRTNLPFVDMSCGMLASNTILAALMERANSGQGQQVDVVLFDTAAMLTAYYGLNFLISGEAQSRYGHAPRGSAPIGLFHASDAAFYLSAGTNRLFERLCTKVIDRPDLLQDVRFATTASRAAHKEPLFTELSASFGARPRAEWLERMKAVAVPAGPVRTIAEAFTSPEVEMRGTVQRVTHPDAPGSIPLIKAPYQLQETPLVRPAAPPLLGEHTRAVLQELLALSAEELVRLEDDGAFGPKR